MSRRPHDRVKTVTDALHMEKQICTELVRALMAQIQINEVLREQIEEMAKAK